MARRRQSVLDSIAAWPWPIGVAIGVLAYLVIRHGVGWYLTGRGDSLLHAFGTQLSNGAFAPLAWMALTLCWIAAAVSFFRRRQRRELLETRTGLDSLAGMTWRQFETLVAEAYRRRGFSVEETGQGGADGGIDLILRKNGRVELVQCKQWRNRQVSAPTVREMWGLRDHHRADAVRIVCIGEFTRDALDFAQGKAIELVNGTRLLELVREVQTARPDNTPVDSASAPMAVRPTEQAPHLPPTCPHCGTGMTRRSNRKTGDSFWGCSGFPRCHGTRAN
ncbi:MAG: restriction endonuclease [Lysobacter sp.]|nr:restriction endonuclease [Lysobacter sp.]